MSVGVFFWLFTHLNVVHTKAVILLSGVSASHPGNHNAQVTFQARLYQQRRCTVYRNITHTNSPQRELDLYRRRQTVWAHLNAKALGEIVCVVLPK